MQFTYAYHINFDNQYQLSFGLSISGYQFKLDDYAYRFTIPMIPC